jgi:indolepyruvate ferredoxin oxidoreductase alpha subunit
MVVMIFDNGTTAMTGFQPHPATGVSATRDDTTRVNIEDIVKACGVKNLKVIDPYNVKESIKIVTDALMSPTVSVIISRRACMLEWLREARRKGIEIELHQVEPKNCTGCKLCISEFGCPAITFTEDKVARIDDVLCNGCGVCAQICPVGAIHKLE